MDDWVWYGLGWQWLRELITVMPAVLMVRSIDQWIMDGHECLPRTVSGYHPESSISASEYVTADPWKGEKLIGRFVLSAGITLPWTSCRRLPALCYQTS